jgi:hypothetical protein
VELDGGQERAEAADGAVPREAKPVLVRVHRSVPVRRLSSMKCTGRSARSPSPLRRCSRRHGGSSLPDTGGSCWGGTAEIGTALMGSKSPKGGGADAACRNRAAALAEDDGVEASSSSCRARLLAAAA